MPYRIFAIVLSFCALVQAAEHETAHYLLATDLRREDAKEAALRLDRVYEQLVVDFSWLKLKPRMEEKKLKAVLFTDRGDYARVTGGFKADACYSHDAQALLIWFGDKTDWHAIAHEAFHQYAHEIIGGEWPAWFNEGTATYYGNGLFTGDSYTLGRVAKWNIKLNDTLFKGNMMVPFPRLFAMTQREWNHHYRIELYNQSFSLVHFMLHSTPAYRQAYQQFVQDIADGKESAAAWKAIIKDERAFLSDWATFWLKQQTVDNEAEFDQRAAALVAVSGIARLNATARGKQVKDLEAFFQLSQGRDFGLKDTAETWLPQSLFRDAATKRDRQARWQLTYDPAGKPVVTVQFRGNKGLQANFEKALGYDRTVLKTLP